MALQRNNYGRDQMNPSVDIQRSKWRMPSDHKFTMNSGKLIPFFMREVLPGDTFNVKTSTIVRASVPLDVPVLDNATMDTFYFYVPYRIVWDHFEEFFGATEKAWNVGEYGDAVPTYFIPHKEMPTVGFSLGSVADYLGIPTYVTHTEANAEEFTCNVLPFRVYSKIYNDYFRDPNMMDEVTINTGDDGEIDRYWYPGSAYDEQFKPYSVSKFKDLFTAALPKPQRGEDVLLDLFPQQYARVFNYGGAPEIDAIPLPPIAGGGILARVSGINPLTAGDSYGLGFMTGSNTNSDNRIFPVYLTDRDTQSSIKVDPVYQSAASQSPVNITLTNLAADLASANAAVSINDLREAFAIQRLLEADARGGTRYVSLIKMHFGVTSPDGRLQRAEYLGGKRFAINTQEVTSSVNTSDAATLGSLGTVAAYSRTVDQNQDFVKSFTEPGLIMGVCCIRTDKTYQYSLDKIWSKKSRYDFYWPEFANIGEQPLLRKEIYFDNDPESNNAVFGYQEPWYEYRYAPSKLSGYFRSNANAPYEDVDGNTLAGTLDYWTFAEEFESAPMLSAAFLEEDPSPIDRALKVTHEYMHQFLVDMYFDVEVTRPMPVVSIPGLDTHF